MPNLNKGDFIRRTRDHLEPRQQARGHVKGALYRVVDFIYPGGPRGILVGAADSSVDALCDIGQDAWERVTLVERTSGPYLGVPVGTYGAMEAEPVHPGRVYRVTVLSGDRAGEAHVWDQTYSRIVTDDATTTLQLVEAVRKAGAAEKEAKAAHEAAEAALEAASTVFAEAAKAYREARASLATHVMGEE